MKLSIERKITLMENFTNTYEQNKLKLNKYQLEVECIKQVYPEVFYGMEENDLLLGRCTVLPIGYSMEWAHLGGAKEKLTRKELTIVNGSSSPEVNSSGSSFYGLVGQLEKMKEHCESEDVARIQNLIEYWSKNDTHIAFCKEYAKTHDTTIFNSDINDFSYPLLLLTRMSGMQLDYREIIEKGILTFQDELAQKNTDFAKAGVEAINILLSVLDYYVEYIKTLPESQFKQDMSEVFDILRYNKPNTFYSAMQLVYLYSQLAGVVNYGRMDDYLGELLVRDIEAGSMTKEKAIDITSTMWHLINESCNRGNGRVAVGGMGRKNPKAANEFARIAIQATIKTHLAKPQLTLRIDESLESDVYDLALEAIAQGCTFPMIYNDEVNVPAIAKAMNIPLSDAVDFLPYGCGEYMINAKSIGTPNACINFAKAMNYCFMNGVDAFDGEYRGGDYQFPTVSEISSYEKFKQEYYNYVKYLLRASVDFQFDSYEFMNERGGFVFTSLLCEDCKEKSAGIIDGGIRYRSGVIEYYGFSNAIDALAAVKKVVFEDQKYTLEQVIEALRTNYESCPEIKQALLSAPKFGNDDDYVDDIAVEFNDFVSNYVNDEGRKKGLYSYLGVNINNNANTRWGMKTSASFDGRVEGEHLAPGNNPHSGRDHQGVTAMLNSVSKYDPSIHAGFVQNLMLSPKLFKENKDIVKALIKSYFKRVGGTQLMITVVDRAQLLEARENPSLYQNLIVRCGGFSAKFVELDEKTQLEIISRTCNA